MKNYFYLMSFFILQSNCKSNEVEKLLPDKERRLGISWTAVFSGMEQSNLKTDCEFEGYKVCCSALQTKNYTAGQVLSDRKLQHLQQNKNCKISKRYFPSPYELAHYEKAKELMMVESSKRKAALIDYLTSNTEIEASLRWLARVKAHMTGRARNSKDDFKYLSYFNVTEVCQGVVFNGKNRKTDKYSIEWIEPLTLHTRHPFSHRHMDNDYRAKIDLFDYSNLTIPFADIPQFILSGKVIADYILLKHSKRKETFSYTDKGVERNFKYMLDAGSSRFESSLFWFTCLYNEV